MMNDLIRRSDIIKEILKGDLLVEDEAGWAIEIVNRTPMVSEAELNIILNKLKGD